MKKTIHIMVVAAFVFMAAFVSPARAQDNRKDMETLAKSYANAYNKKDAKAIKQFYTKDAVRVNPDGTTTNGSEAIGSDATDFFANNNPSIKIDVVKVTESNGILTTMGTYSGSIVSTDISGNYTNT